MRDFLYKTHGFIFDLLDEKEKEVITMLWRDKEWISLSKIFSGFAVHGDLEIIKEKIGGTK